MKKQINIMHTIKNKGKTLLLATLLAGTMQFVPSLARAQGIPAELKLKDCISYALQHNTDVQKAALDKKEVAYKANEIKGGGLPQLKAVGSLDAYPSIPTQILPGEIIGQPGKLVPVKFGTKYNMSGGVEATQLIYSQQFLSGLRAARSSQELYALMEIKTREDVIYNISGVYYQVLQMDEQLNTLNANLEKLNKLEALMRSQYENDLIKKVDYQRILVNITNLQTQKQSFVSGLEQQKNYLKLLMGMPAGQEIKLDNAPLKDFDAQAQLSPQALNTDRLVDLKLLNKQKELSILERSSFKAGYYPTLSAYGRYTYQAQRNEFDFLDTDKNWFNIAVVGLQLNIPIFDGLQKYNKVKQADIRLMKLDLDMENARQYKAMEYNNANTQLLNSLKSVQVQKDNVKLAEEVYNQTNLMYKESIATLADLLDAETALREARTGYNAEVLKFRLAELDGLKAQGELNTLIQ